MPHSFIIQYYHNTIKYVITYNQNIYLIFTSLLYKNVYNAQTMLQ